MTSIAVKIISPRYAIALIAALFLSGCLTNDSGDNTVFLDPQPDQDPTFTIAGLISSEAATAVDGDVNDIQATYTNNDTLENAQAISNLVTVQGFASRTATRGSLSGSAALERFSGSADVSDYYSVSLQAGQTVRLEVVDFDDTDGSAGDLDLFLYDTSGNVVSSSRSITGIETVTAPDTDSYFVEVLAFSGISKYSLQVGATSSGITNLNAPFVTGDVIIRYESQAQALAMEASISASLAPMALTATHLAGGGDRPMLLALSQVSNNAVGDSLRQLAVTSSSAVASEADSGTTDWATLQTFANSQRDTLTAIKTLGQQNGIRYAEPNYIRQPMRTPTDPDYVLQWHYESIELPLAWELTTGTPAEGENDVIIAVVDTGVYLNHPDLRDQLTNTGYDFISSTVISNDGDGIDSDPDDPGDSRTTGTSSWHGTHVSGTAAASANNSLGGSGVSWGARIMPIRVLGVGGGTSYDIMQGIRYAAGLSNDSGTVPSQAADVINMSLGGSGSSISEQETITEAYEAGSILVAAAGNSASSVLNYPASYDGVISVSATDISGGLAFYSDFGSAIDVAAPGGNTLTDANLDGQPDGVYSTLVDDSGSVRRSTYGFYNGTSMASPHVAGVIALMKAVHPELTPTQVDALLFNELITDDFGSAGRDDQFGWGQINAFKAVTQALELANGGAVDLPVLLRASPSSITLSSDSSGTVSLTNAGGGTLTVQEVTDDADWISVAPSDVDESGLGDYTISVDGTGLDEGFYSGSITFVTDQGDLTVSVVMTVGDLSGTGELTQQYVLFVDTASNSIVQEAPINEAGIFSTTLSAGSYLVFAGSDIDVDLFICDAGETCGAYPSLSTQQILEVTEDRSDVNFSVSIQTLGSSDEDAETSHTEEDSAQRVHSGTGLVRPAL